MAGPTIGASPSLPSATYSGKTDSASVQHSGDCYGGKASVDITLHLDPTVILTLAMWCSSDNGVTWKKMAECSRPGGVTKNPMTGLSETQMSIVAWGKPNPHATNPLVKVSVEVSNGSLLTSASASTYASIPGSVAAAKSVGLR